MKMHDAISRYSPDHKHLIGIVPDDELAARVIAELAEDAVDAEEMYSEHDYNSAVDDAESAGKEEIREEVEHVLNNVEWSTADELAVLIRKAIE